MTCDGLMCVPAVCTSVHRAQVVDLCKTAGDARKGGVDLDALIELLDDEEASGGGGGREGGDDGVGGRGRIKVGSVSLDTAVGAAAGDPDDAEDVARTHALEEAKHADGGLASPRVPITQRKLISLTEIMGAWTDAEREEKVSPPVCRLQ